jgi:prepilin-type N-terminal cleavage/methylation domain-containing protein
MKTRQTVEGRGSRVERPPNTGPRVSGPRLPTFDSRPAFTLIELLVVIAIIAVLASLILPVAGMVKRHAFIQTAQAEMAQIETAIERYKSAYGFYPPDSSETMNNVPINQLYYELVGTTNNGPNYVTLDNSASIPIVAMTGGQAFGANVSGFMNCSKTNADESAPHAQDFLPDLKPYQIAQNITNQNGVSLTLLVSSTGGPDPNYPLGIADANPWRYNSSSPTNNPGSYDLYVQLRIGGKTNLICNWNKQVQLGNPLP